MTTIHLHIGMSKAGSSALQTLLAVNQDALEARGIVYPRAGRSGGGHLLLVRHIRERDSFALFEEALQEAAGRRAAVLSSEGFWFLDDARVAALARALAGHDVRVLLYLRAPGDYLVASYRQGIKRGQHRAQPAQWFARRPNRAARLDYPALLERWARHFPLRVRCFETVRQALEQDFLAAIGTPVAGLDTRRREVNPTPDEGVLRLQLAANRHLTRRHARWVWHLLRASRLRLSWLPGLEDGVLRGQGRALVQGWDLEVLRRHLPERDLERLLA